MKVFMQIPKKTNNLNINWITTSSNENNKPLTKTEMEASNFQTFRIDKVFQMGSKSSSASE